MAPKSNPVHEFGEGINGLRRRLNKLHRPRPGLNLPIFFPYGDAYDLGPAWTSKMPISVETNLRSISWFSTSPYSDERGISFK